MSKFEIYLSVLVCILVTASVIQVVAICAALWGHYNA